MRLPGCRPYSRPRASLRSAALLSLAVAAASACARAPAERQAPPTSGPASVLAPPVSSEAAERERAARRVVQDARAFLRQGRPEAALHATTRGLAIRPEDAPLWRTRALALEALGRSAEAVDARARADALDPPPPPLPSGPRAGHFDDLLLVIQAPEIDLASPRERDRARAAAALQSVLLARLAERLPGAAWVFEADADLGSVPEARRWLAARARPRVAGLRVDRAFCGDSIKDGPFAVASLHRTQPGKPPVDEPVRWTGRPEAEDVPIDQTSAPDAAAEPSCASRALERAVEVWLQDPFFDDAPGLDAAAGASEVADDDRAVATIDRESLLALLPALRARIDEEHAIARRALFVGDLTSARAAYERAAALDPEDGDIAEHLAEIDRTIELNRQLVALEAAERGPRGKPGAGADANAASDPGLLPAQLTEAQRAALERQLEDERRRRDDLLATLATLTGDRRSAHVPEAARESELVDPDATGPRRALVQIAATQTASPAAPAAPIDASRLAVRTLHSPSGALIARYYFDREDAARGDAGLARDAAAPGPLPILVEEDASGDGRLDRWTTYADGVRTATWEERQVDGLPDLHVVYARDGLAMVRVEFDDGGDGQPDRSYRYVDGLLAHAALDVDGDGRFDRFDHFDAQGRVELRDEDLTGDGRIDVRTTFRDGRLLKREITDPAALGGLP